jgi:flagellar motor switch protein FliG
MGKNNIVLTLYGSGKDITDCMVTLFDEEQYSLEKDTNAQDYCSSMNELDLKGDCWVYASIIKQNQKIKLIKPGLPDFNVLGSLDNRSIDKVIYEIDHDVLVLALKNAKKETLKAVLRNMSKRGAKMLIEDMKRNGPVVLKDVNEAQRKVALAIHRLVSQGEIVIPEPSHNE